jgi:hypothetical protein
VIEARVSDDYMIDGIAIWIALKHGPGDRRLLRLTPDPGVTSWEEHEPLAQAVPPTLKLPDEAARALLDALLRHYQGAEDLRTVRSDLLHERGRVDRLTSGLLQIAIHASGSAHGTGRAP